jgi:hypothetical protein
MVKIETDQYIGIAINLSIDVLLVGFQVYVRKHYFGNATGKIAQSLSNNFGPLSIIFYKM